MGSRAKPQVPIEEVEKAFALHDWLANRLDGLKVPKAREILLPVLCYDLVIEHHLGVAVLLRSGVYASALALIRPTFESYVRGVWLRYCADENDLDLYVRDRLDRKISHLIADVEGTPNFAGGVLSSLQKQLWRVMNSFTHSGIQQAGRRMSSEMIEAVYSTDDVVRTARFAGTFALLAFQQMAVEANRLDLAEEAIALMRSRAAEFETS